MTDETENKVTIRISQHETGVDKIFTLSSALTIQEVIKIVSQSFSIRNPEAYGLCYPDAEKLKQKGSSSFYILFSQHIHCLQYIQFLSLQSSS